MAAVDSRGCVGWKEGAYVAGEYIFDAVESNVGFGDF